MAVVGCAPAHTPRTPPVAGVGEGAAAVAATGGGVGLRGTGGAVVTPDGAASRASPSKSMLWSTGASGMSALKSLLLAGEGRGTVELLMHERRRWHWSQHSWVGKRSGAYLSWFGSIVVAVCVLLLSTNWTCLAESVLSRGTVYSCGCGEGGGGGNGMTESLGVAMVRFVVVCRNDVPMSHVTQPPPGTDNFNMHHATAITLFVMSVWFFVTPKARW